jgi:Meiotically up-regulated gene 113
MATSKAQIVAEIARTAAKNGGVALGWRRFAEETGIGYYDWFGRFWSKWSDATREAGLEPNRMNEAIDENVLIGKLVALTRSLGHIPTQGDLLMAARNDLTFPSEKVFRRLGSKPERASRIVEFCRDVPDGADVAALWQVASAVPIESAMDDAGPDNGGVGYVYLVKHGSRREYKIGRTNNPLRREGEIAIQLPEKLSPIHYIETDDPSGIESYWHARFASNGRKANGLS